MHIGMVGLGKMGMNMTRRLLNGGHKVTAFARTASTVNEAVSFGALPSKSLKELASTLPCPRVVWLMVPSGAATSKAAASGTLIRAQAEESGALRKAIASWWAERNPTTNISNLFLKPLPGREGCFIAALAGRGIS